MPACHAGDRRFESGRVRQCSPGWEDVGITYWSGNGSTVVALAAVLIAVGRFVVGFAAGLGMFGHSSPSPTCSGTVAAGGRLRAGTRSRRLRPRPGPRATGPAIDTCTDRRADHRHRRRRRSKRMCPWCRWSASGRAPPRSRAIASPVRSPATTPSTRRWSYQSEWATRSMPYLALLGQEQSAGAAGTRWKLTQLRWRVLSPTVRWAWCRCPM